MGGGALTEQSIGWEIAEGDEDVADERSLTSDGRDGSGGAAGTLGVAPPHLRAKKAQREGRGTL